MNNPDSTQIVIRFFDALDRLKTEKVIHGIINFTDRHEINRRNLSQLKKDPTRNIFQVSWLAYLHHDYNVSIEWLIFGTGDFYARKRKGRSLRKKTPPPVTGSGEPTN